MQTKKIQILISEPVEINGMTIAYNDALYYTEEQFEKLTQEDIDAEVKLRVENFQDAINNPPPVPEPSQEDIELQLQQIEQQKIQLESMKVETIEKLAVFSDERLGDLSFQEVLELKQQEPQTVEELQVVQDSLEAEKVLLDQKQVEIQVKIDALPISVIEKPPIDIVKDPIVDPIKEPLVDPIMVKLPVTPIIVPIVKI